MEGADTAWQAFRDRFATHLGRFGHIIYDLDFAKAVPLDDPAPLLETLAFFLSGQAPDPRARRQRPRASATARPRPCCDGCAARASCCSGGCCV